MFKNYIQTNISIIFFIVFILFPLFYKTSLSAEELKIKSITIKGNIHFTQSEIINSLNMKKGDDFSYQELNNSLNNILELLKKHGFYFAKILPPEVTPDQSGKYVHIKIEIEEGEKIYVSVIFFSGNKYFSDNKLKNLIYTKTNQLFRVNRINSDIKAIVDAYSQKGYPFCHVKIDSLSAKENNIDIHIKIQENDFVRISKLLYKGNEITKARTLNMILNFKKNEIYDSKKIQLAKQNLLRKKYIEDVNITPLNSSELLVKIKEKRMNHFQGVLGISSSENNSSIWDRLTGFIDFSFLNIMGTDRNIDLFWKRIQQNTLIFNISYREPFIFNQQLSIILTLNRKSIDTVYVNTDIKITGNFLRYNYNKLSLSYIYSNSLIDTTRTEKQGIGGQILTNRINYPINPTSGYSILLNYTIDWKTKKSYYQKIYMDSEYLIPFSNKSVTYLRALVKLIYSSQDSLTKYELYEFGGYDNLRGFIDNQFTSAKFGILNFEYRYLISRDSRVFAFIDYAISEEYNNLYGIGFGIRIKSKIGIMKIDYGIGNQNGKWANPLQGTIHFGIETEF